MNAEFHRMSVYILDAITHPRHDADLALLVTFQELKAKMNHFRSEGKKRLADLTMNARHRSCHWTPCVLHGYQMGKWILSFYLLYILTFSSTILEWKGLHLSDVAVNYRVSALSLEVQGSTSLCFWCSSIRWVAGSSLSRSIWKIISVKHSHRRLRPKRLAIDRSSSMSLVFECGRNGTMVWLIHDQRWHMLAGTASSPWKISSALLRGFWRQQSYAGAELFQRTLEDGWRAAYERPKNWWGGSKGKPIVWYRETLELSFLATISKRTQEVWDGAWEGALLWLCQSKGSAICICLNITRFVL